MNVLAATTFRHLPHRPGVMLPAAALGVAALAALAWQGGALASVAVVAVALLGWVFGQRPADASAAPADDETEAPPQPQAGRAGTGVMVEQVVPVWSRQLGVTRDAAAQGLDHLLASFTGMSSALDDLSRELEHFSPTLAAGAGDDAEFAQSAPMRSLLASSERAFAERNRVVEVLGRCAEALADLQQQAKASHEIARHTRLVAFNASIEAHRGGGSGGSANGSQAVANELRELAGRMAATGEAVHRTVSRLAQSVSAARREGDLRDTTVDELRLELQIRAREALAEMLGNAGSSLGGTRMLEQASRSLREQLDAAFVNFQFGDRLSQMLSIVGNDMTNFAAWVARHPQATQTDAAEWLEALEASYTMEEQRAHHHGNVHVDRGSEVEFF